MSGGERSESVAHSGEVLDNGQTEEALDNLIMNG